MGLHAQLQFWIAQRLCKLACPVSTLRNGHARAQNDQANIICQAAELKGRPRAGSRALRACADSLQESPAGCQLGRAYARKTGTRPHYHALGISTPLCSKTLSFAIARYRHSWARGARKGAAELALRTPAVQHWTCHADSAPSARDTTRSLVQQYKSGQCDMAAGDVHFPNNENAKRHGRSAAIAAGPYRHTAQRVPHDAAQHHAQSIITQCDL